MCILFFRGIVKWTSRKSWISDYKNKFPLQIVAESQDRPQDVPRLDPRKILQAPTKPLLLLKIKKPTLRIKTTTFLRETKHVKINKTVKHSLIITPYSKALANHIIKRNLSWNEWNKIRMNTDCFIF